VKISFKLRHESVKILIKLNIIECYSRMSDYNIPDTQFEYIFTVHILNATMSSKLKKYTIYSIL